MVFQLQRADGTRDSFDAGTWIDADGRVRHLARDSFELRPARFWRDAQAVRWPVSWEISCAVCGGQLLVQADVDDQRMDTLIQYWEGLVSVFDARGERIGSGYMELTGY
jgi:predicted secreted hydrolase